MLEEQVLLDLQKAMRQKEEIRVSTLRMLRAAITNRAIEKRKSSLTDEEVVAVMGREIKKHKESIESYRNGGRMDLVAKEEEELKILESYAPAGLTDEELMQLIADVLKKTGAQSKADLGRVMKEVMGQAKGRAEGKRINEFVTRALGG